MSEMPDKGKVGGVVLKKVPEGKTPEHYLWKKTLEKEWAGEWTIARLTNYHYKVVLDPSFVEELPEFKKGRLHFYEWLLCENGGIIYLYDEKNMILSLLTPKQTAEKVLDARMGASTNRTQEDRLSHELHFQTTKLLEVCKLAGVRKARHPQLTEEEKARRGENLRAGRLKKMSGERYQASQGAK